MNLEAFYVGVWGRLLLQLEKSGYLNRDLTARKFRLDDETGKKEKLSLTEQDVLAIYMYIREKIKDVPQHKIDEYAILNNDYVQALINDEQQVSNTVLACAMYQSYLYDIAGIEERNKMQRKVESVIGGFGNKESAKYSARCGDNLYRQFVGKAQLSDEVRDARAAKFLKKGA